MDDNKEIDINESEEELGEWTKEMLKPENLSCHFTTTDELMKSLWDED